jgi:putative ABC transport system permease protein
MHQIELLDLGLGFIPVLVTMAIMMRWSMSPGRAMIAVLRMLAQLVLIGYLLNYIFTSEGSLLVILVLSLMLLAASWISLNSVPIPSRWLYLYSLYAIAVGGVFTLAITTQGILHLDPWYSPRSLIPIAGMIFSNSMTAISLAGERFFSEYEDRADFTYCRDIAYRAALIPVINSLLAVGLVSLPGMMTGQILSGVSPLLAVRYQIMVMLMIFGSAGISAAIFLTLLRRQLTDNRPAN